MTKTSNKRRRDLALLRELKLIQLLLDANLPRLALLRSALSALFFFGRFDGLLFGRFDGHRNATSLLSELCILSIDEAFP